VYHDKLYLLKIERWARRFAWYFLAGLVLGMFSLVYKGIAIFVNPESMGLLGKYANIWVKLLIIFGSAKAIFVNFSIYLLLQAISKTIRYLLALKEDMEHKYSGCLSE